MRRLAPADWGHGYPIGSHAAVSQAAAVSLIAGIARVPGIEWLTPIDPLLICESKLLQIRVADRLGIQTPRTVVTNNVETAIRELGADVVIKPLGPGHFTADDGTPAVVYATPVDLAGPEFQDLGPTPFLLQQRIVAHTHLRVVTVRSQCWVAELDANGLPVDWRANEAAHSSFRAPTTARDAVVKAALLLADELGLGYSSQDWIVTPTGDEVLLDVNPAGQWLFLPEPIGTAVSAAIASWLNGG
jgi:glutathione synthase/RimK-type ligase-like ATP-grasp enzyme